jgi:hypothetical protein
MSFVPFLLATSLGLAAAIAPGDDSPPNYVDHVEPIVSEYCLACHRGSRARNGLQLSSVPKILAGGSSGAAIAPGDPDGSLLIKLVEHAQGPFMPPDEDMLPAAERATLRAWIAGGARVDANDKGTPAAPVEAAPLPILSGGPAPMPPSDLSLAPLTWTDRGGPLTALAASPGAPFAAVGGLGQVALYALPGGERPAGELLGVLAFPEGRPERLSFSATGAVLLVAGGRAGKRGLAVGYDVATGQRLFAVGDEPETVLAADVTADLAVVALGGPDRVLRAYDPASGALRWESRAHTDWVTAIAASPDSALIVSGDRAGGLVVHEAFTGREFQRPAPSRGPVTGLAWRADGARFAVTDEAGNVRVFDPENGKQVASWTAHKTAGGGVLDVAWLEDGGLVTVGRDGEVRVTNGAGKVRGKPRKLGAPTLAVAAAADATHALIGDLLGGARLLRLDGVEAERPLTLAAYPPPAALRALRASEAEKDACAARVAELASSLESTVAAWAAAEDSGAEATAAAGDAASRVAEAAAAAVTVEALLSAARACVAPLEAARAAAAASTGDDAGARGQALARWDAMLAGAREEVVRTEARQREASAAEGIAADEALAAQARAAARALEVEQRLGARDAMQAEVEAARAAHADATEVTSRLAAAWSAERTPAGQWRSGAPR